MSEYVNFGTGTAEPGSPLRVIVAKVFNEAVTTYRTRGRQRAEVMEWLRSEEARDLARFIGLPVAKLADELEAGGCKRLPLKRLAV